MTEIQVSTTEASRENASALASHVIKSGFADCAQVIRPVKSMFHWKEKLETTDEWLVLLKLVDTGFTKLEVAIRKVHSYDVPEIIVVPIVAGSKEYLAWVRSETNSK